MINKSDIKFLIERVLQALAHHGTRRGMDSPEAVLIVYETGLVESDYRHLRQKLSRGRIGVARSFFQIEPNTARSIINNYIEYRPSIMDDLEEICMCDLSKMDDPEEDSILEIQLMSNIALSICLCRLKYRPVPKPIPALDDLEGRARYHLKYYNAGGKATIARYLKVVRKYND